MLEKYATLVSEGKSEIYIEKSRFLGFASSVCNAEEAELYIRKIKNIYRDATHCCYAYKLVDNTKRFSDDAEPQGTAGLPMLDCIEKKNLFNVVVAVVRYFGGIKLGAGGLLRAYSKTASEALANSQIGVYTKCVTADVYISYSHYDIFKNFMKNIIHKEDSVEFGLNIKISLICELNEFKKIKEYLESFKGSAVEITGENYYSI